MWFSGARRPRGPSLASGRRSARRRACRRRRPESSGVGRRGRGRRLWVALAVPLLAACAVGPRYRRPAVPTPETTRGQRGPADPASLADSPWWAVFRDPALQALVEEAIRGSHDLRAAAARVEQARNQIAVARADMFPQVSYQGQAVRERTFVPLPGATGKPTLNSFLGTFNLAWEIDVWGRIRRATEAARADYLAAEAARRGVLLTLVSDVAQAYFELLELDRELEITHSTTITFQDTVNLFQRRYVGGIGTLLEVSRAMAALTQARAGIPELERQVVVKENQLSTLLGRPPSDIAHGALPEGESPAPETPVGLPAPLLERSETVKALQTSVALSLKRYNDGIASYFEVLEAEQQLFPAELDLARTQRDELVAVVTLYRALGGGWRLAVPDWSAAPDRSAAGEMPRTPAGD